LNPFTSPYLTPMFDRITPTNWTIVGINVIVYLLQLNGVVGDQFALWPLSASVYGHFEVWQIVTHAFMHGSWTHLFFNMFAVVMFGSDVERWLGSNRYITYYLVCALGAALMQLVVVQLAHLPPVPMVGASGAVFGLLLAFGLAFPFRKLILLPIPVPMPAWLFVTLYGLAELFFGVTQTLQGIAHFAHVGGMVTGFLLIKYWQARLRAGRGPDGRPDKRTDP
jgi:membrane associated rhomboid family serine protease